MHGHPKQLLSELHGDFIVRDDDELHFLGHPFDQFNKPAHIVVVQRRVHLVKNAEWRGVQLEYGKHQGHGRQGLFAAGQQMDVAVFLAWRPGHDSDAGLQKILLSHLQASVTAAEQQGKVFLQVVVQLVKGLLEPGPGFLVDLAHGPFQGLQGRA